MMDYREQIEALLEQASEMEHCPAQVALLEQAVQIADAHADVAIGFEVRQELMEAATFSGSPDRMLVAFSWCLSQCDREPEKFDQSELLWKYKWVVDHLPEFPQISRAQMEEMFTDMERRFREAGSNLHAIWQIRRDVAVTMGDRATALKMNKQFEAARRDWLSNCAACVADATIDFYTFLGDDQTALRSGEAIFSGRMRCAEVPHRTHARVLLPLFRLGRVSEAIDHHRQGYRMVSDNPNFLRHWAMHLTLMVLTDNLARGVKMLQRHLPDALEAVSLSWQFEFLLAARLLLSRLRQQGQATLPLRMPADFPVTGSEGKYAVNDLLTWCDGRLNELARSFDTRNGNDFFRQRIAELAELETQVRPFPIPSRARKKDDAEAEE